MWPFKYPYTNFHEMNLDWLLETVKSNTDRIAENEQKIKLIGGDDPLNSLHPVGSIFISTENTSPASMFGGEWEQIGGRFLLGADSTYAAGSTGGEATHKLTIEEMPTHAHYITASRVAPGDNYGGGIMISSHDLYDYPISQGINSTGGGQPHNNMPPYLTVYMWRRVS